MATSRKLETREAALKGLLVVVSEAIGGCEPRELAALSREKRRILVELESLAGSGKGSAIDELDRRREARRAAATVRASAGRGGVKRRPGGG